MQANLYFDSVHLPSIERELYRMRPWHPGDATSLVKHANNPRVARNLRDGFPYPYTLPDARRWLDMVAENQLDLILALEIEGEAAGGIGIHAGKDVYRYNGEIGYWLSEIYWGKGIMTDAVATLVDHAFKHTKWLRLFATIFESNIPSKRILEKCGFRHEATHKHTVMKEGKLLDEHLFALLKAHWKSRQGIS
jgi:ribosomal-protein-alanine N-acetyltransferase